MDSFFVAQKSLDALWMRQKAISQNISNQDTPGYKARKVLFEELFQTAARDEKSLQKIAEDFENVLPRTVSDTSTKAREDGNNVDEDAENLELLRTQLQYESMVRSVSSHISRMKYVINEGRG
jgi:flagellar basal-body rod protein FlgB